MDRKHVIAALGALGLLAACGGSPEQHLASGSKSFAEHRFAAARVELLAALDGNANDARALELLARTQLELNDGEAALAALDRLAKLGKLPADGAILRGDAQLLRAKPALAITAVEGLNTAEAYRIRALAAIARGDAAAATSAFTTGEDASGPQQRLLAEAARFALLRGDLPAARARVERAQKAGDALEVALAAGQVAAAQGNMEGALAAYAGAARRWPESRPAILGQLGALGDLGRVKDMEPILAGAMKQSPNDPAFIYMQARMAAAGGDWQQTRALLQRMEPQLPLVPQAELLYGQALAELKMPDQAIGHYKAYLRKDPASRPALRLLARAQIASGDAARAVATIRPLATAGDAAAVDLAVMADAARAAGAADAASWRARAEASGAQKLAAQLATADAALKRKDWNAAAGAYRGVLAMTDGRNVMVLNNLAYAEGQAGRHAAALEFANRALKLAPENPSVLDTAGWIMVQGNLDRARGVELLRKAARLAPENPAIAQHLALATR